LDRLTVTGFPPESRPLLPALPLARVGVRGSLHPFESSGTAAAGDRIDTGDMPVTASERNQRVDAIGDRDAVERAQPVTLAPLEQPVRPVPAVTAKLQESFATMAAVGDVPDVAGQEMTVRAGMAPFLERNFQAGKWDSKRKEYTGTNGLVSTDQTVTKVRPCPPAPALDAIRAPFAGRPSRAFLDRRLTPGRAAGSRGRPLHRFH